MRFWVQFWGRAKRESDRVECERVDDERAEAEMKSAIETINEATREKAMTLVDLEAKIRRAGDKAIAAIEGRKVRK